MILNFWDGFCIGLIGGVVLTIVVSIIVHYWLPEL